MDLGALQTPRLPVVLVLILAIALAACMPGIRGAFAPLLSRVGGLLRGADPGRDFGRDSLLWRHLCVALLAGAFLLVTRTNGHYGYNVDEWFQITHAEALFEWYRDLLLNGKFADFHADVEQMKHYGGGFEIVAEIAVRLSLLELGTTRHLVTAFTGLFGLIGAYLLGCSLSSRAAGFAAVVILLITPRFYGQFASNPKDVPFAIAMLWALLGICRALPQLPRLSAKMIGLVGCAIGLAAGVRVGGLIALLYFCVALGWGLGGALRRARRVRVSSPGVAQDVARLIVAGLGVLGVAWGVMLLFWPWAMSDPMLRPFQALGYFQDIVDQQKIDFLVFFEGEYTLLSEIPRYFTLKSLLLTMPEFALLAPVLLTSGIGLLRRGGLRWPDARSMCWILCAVAVALPLAMTASEGLIQYDGIRHFLFVLPPLAVLFAAALVESLASRHSARFKTALATACLLLALLTANDMWRLHPYEYTYFNRSVAGGLKGAAADYETDFLGLSYREGFGWLVDHYRPRARGPIRISGCRGFPVNLKDALDHAGLRGRRFQAVFPDRDPEVAIATTRGRCNEGYDGQLLATIERDGVPLLYVLKLR